MKITALALYVALAGIASASPVKRQASSVVESVVASATSAIQSAVSSGSAVASSASSASSSTPSSDFASGLLNALRERQATTLATLLAPMADTLGPILQQGQHTLFAPGNEYLANVPSTVTSNMTLLGEILSYHIVAGDYPAAGLVENQTVIAPTLLADNMLGANNTQFPLSFVQDVFGTTRIIGQNASVLANSTYENILIKLIDGVLIPPGNITSVLAANGGDALVGALTALLPNVVQTLDTTQGVTVFAPDNASIEEATATLASVAQSNPQAVASVVEGHVLSGVVYSTNITEGLNVTSLGGTPLSFTTNTTGVFVIGNGVTAQITNPDIIAQNGVVHIINRLLFTPPSASAAASSGASSAVAPVASASRAAESATGAIGGAASSATAAIASAVPSA